MPPVPIEIKPPGIGIDLHRDPVLGADFEDLLDIDFVAGRRSNCLPVMCPRIVVRGWATARRILSVCSRGSMRNRLWTLATTKSN